MHMWCTVVLPTTSSCLCAKYFTIIHTIVIISAMLLAAGEDIENTRDKRKRKKAESESLFVTSFTNVVSSLQL